LFVTFCAIARYPLSARVGGAANSGLRERTPFRPPILLLIPALALAACGRKIRCIHVAAPTFRFFDQAPLALEPGPVFLCRLLTQPLDRDLDLPSRLALAHQGEDMNETRLGLAGRRLRLDETDAARPRKDALDNRQKA
jgi:hypothetical protein